MAVNRRGFCKLAGLGVLGLASGVGRAEGQAAGPPEVAAPITRASAGLW